MQDYPKCIKKQLCELSGVAYKRELDSALSDLHKLFEAWQQNKINCWDLSDAIHKFHDGISRDLYKQYVMSGSHYSLPVAYALARKILCREEISDEVYQLIEPMLSFISCDSI
ncbi:MAG: hypothetical protein M1561_07380 [Gammaproteobacteria bacterium]|nr:hypothetical protein [Gammaproteobacteria bacterium]